MKPPSVSGGDHRADWPTPVVELLTKLLASKPAAASELKHHLDFKTDRASIRRWARQNKLAPDTRYKPKPIKRWQARDLGALWQYDASPHAWLPENPDKQTLLSILDDATHYNTGAPRSKVIRCLRPDGDIYFLQHAPDPKNKPVILLHCPVF